MLALGTDVAAKGPRGAMVSERLRKKRKWHVVQSSADLAREIKGPDNPTSQFLPISRSKSSSGMGKEG